MRKKVILISGKLQSGKNSSADIIFNILNEKNKSNEHLFFAKDLKDACKEDFQLLKNYLNDFIGSIILKYTDDVNYGVLKELSKLRISDDNFYENKTDMTRLLLQLYGTEIFRNRVGKNYWVDKVVDKIIEAQKEYYILTDVRFPNEINHLENKLNGITSLRDYDVIKIRINRSDINRKSTIDEHPSETALDEYDGWDYVINTNGDLEELQNKTIKIIKEIVDEEE